MNGSNKNLLCKFDQSCTTSLTSYTWMLRKWWTWESDSSFLKNLVQTIRTWTFSKRLWQSPAPFEYVTNSLQSVPHLMTTTCTTETNSVYNMGGCTSAYLICQITGFQSLYYLQALTAHSRKPISASYQLQEISGLKRSTPPCFVLQLSLHFFPAMIFCPWSFNLFAMPKKFHKNFNHLSG
jgi:hypothetical protein